MRFNLYSLAAGLYRLYTKHIALKPRCRAGSPTMTKTLAKAYIAIFSAIAVDVVCSGRNNFVDTAGLFGIRIVEMFPESSCSEVKH